MKVEKVFPVIIASFLCAYSYNVHSQINTLKFSAIDCMQADIPRTSTVIDGLVSKEQLFAYRFHTDSGKQIHLIDNPVDGDAFVIHTYCGFQSDLDSVIFRQDYYEGSGALVINLMTNQSLFLANMPIISPDKKWFADCGLDLEEGSEPNQVRIWQLNKAEGGMTFMKEVLNHREPKDGLSLGHWGPLDCAWESNNRLSFKIATLNQDDGELMAGNLVAIDLKDGQWVWPDSLDDFGENN